MIFVVFGQIVTNYNNAVGLEINSLPVANYMTPYPIKVSKSSYFGDVVDIMASHGIGNVVVVHARRPIGVVTERDLLQCAISYQSDFYEKQVSHIGYQKFVAIEPSMSVLKAAKTMIRKKARLLVFDDNKLVGIITASDMLHAFRKTDESPSLEKVFSDHIYAHSPQDSIFKVIKTMQQKKIGSVIVGKTGIFTERDLLVHILANNIDLNLPVGGYSTYPLITAKYGIEAKEAASIMAQNNIKRLVLTNNGALVGIVTARDIVDAYQATYPTSDPYLEK